MGIIWRLALSVEDSILSSSDSRFRDWVVTGSGDGGGVSVGTLPSLILITSKVGLGSSGDGVSVGTLGSLILMISSDGLRPLGLGVWGSKSFSSVKENS